MSNYTNELCGLDGKIALVTGATQGLGFTMATGLGKAGATVVFNGRNADKVANAQKEYEALGIKAHGLVFDVTDSKAIKAAVEKIETEIGAIDILINNAGIMKKAPLEDFPEEDWQNVLDINLTAPQRVAQFVAQKMIPRKSGKIINICSMMSELGRPTTGAYAAAKGGLKMLTRAMATEWARHNIQVNGIGPGYHLTAITQPLKDTPKFNDLLMARTPAKRWGTPEDLIGPAIFLSSEASSFVNGHVLYVDGGILASFGDN